MNTQRKLIAALSLCAAVAVPGLSFGALIDRGGGLIYDTDLNITWISDVDYYHTTGNPVGGLTWYEANTWAANLSYYDSVRDVTYNDWRLPKALEPDPSCPAGYAGYCSGGELGHLYYIELNGIRDEDNNTVGYNDNYNLFTNHNRIFYIDWVWYGNDLINREDAYFFDFEAGYQSGYDKLDRQVALAVRDGDVYAASTVPIPAAAWLFGSGLIGLIGVARKHTH